MDISSRFTKESSVAPGVKYTIRRLNYIQRAKRECALVEYRDLIGTKYQRLESLKDKTGITDEEIRERRILDREISALHSQHIAPAVIKAGLVKIEGLTCDGKPVTSADALVDLGPDADELIAEIWAECEVASGLDSGTLKNSQLPGTSSEVEQARLTNTIAESASATDTTETESA